VQIRTRNTRVALLYTLKFTVSAITFDQAGVPAHIGILQTRFVPRSRAAVPLRAMFTQALMKPQLTVVERCAPMQNLTASGLL
jgi:hypothetical protein